VAGCWSYFARFAVAAATSALADASLPPLAGDALPAAEALPVDAALLVDDAPELQALTASSAAAAPATRNLFIVFAMCFLPAFRSGTCRVDFVDG
jgi:hypothetical protein